MTLKEIALAALGLFILAGLYVVFVNDRAPQAKAVPAAAALKK